MLLGLHLIEERVQCFKAGLPVPAELLGPEHRFLERRSAQAAEVLPPGYAATHELGPLQHAHVLGGGGERHPKGRGELAEVALPAGELPDDRAAGGVGQGVEDAVEPGGSIYYHMVYYTRWFHDVNPAPVSGGIGLMRMPSLTAKTFSRLPLVLLSLLATLASAQTRTQDVIYMKAGGTAFTMDVLKPARPNKAAVVFLVSGGWISDHTMIKTFGADVEKAFAHGGFTVFSVVHGAQPRFKVAEIVEQGRTAVRFVHAHAADYGIDTNRVGISGISSGGHLSLMIAGSPDSPVKAVAAIAPPADLANWGKPGFVLTDDPQMAVFIPALGIDPKGPRERHRSSGQAAFADHLCESQVPTDSDRSRRR